VHAKYGVLKERQLQKFNNPAQSTVPQLCGKVVYLISTQNTNKILIHKWGDQVKTLLPSCVLGTQRRIRYLLSSAGQSSASSMDRHN